MKNFNTTQNKLQPTDKNFSRMPFCFLGLRLLCDECAAPLHLYGENFIETYTNGRANILRALCDLHAEEMGVQL